MFITVVAVLCSISINGYCVEQIIADSDTVPGMTVEKCQIGAQMHIAMWMANDPKFSEGWKLAEYKCISGHYVPRTGA